MHGRRRGVRGVSRGKRKTDEEESLTSKMGPVPKKGAEKRPLTETTQKHAGQWAATPLRDITKTVQNNGSAAKCALLKPGPRDEDASAGGLRVAVLGSWNWCYTTG